MESEIIYLTWESKAKSIWSHLRTTQETTSYWWRSVNQRKLAKRFMEDWQNHRLCQKLGWKYKSCKSNASIKIFTANTIKFVIITGISRWHIKYCSRYKRIRTIAALQLYSICCNRKYNEVDNEKLARSQLHNKKSSKKKYYLGH